MVQFYFLWVVKFTFQTSLEHRLEVKFLANVSNIYYSIRLYLINPVFQSSHSLDPCHKYTMVWGRGVLGARMWQMSDPPAQQTRPSD